MDQVVPADFGVNNNAMSSAVVMDERGNVLATLEQFFFFNTFLNRAEASSRRRTRVEVAKAVCSGKSGMPNLAVEFRAVHVPCTDGRQIAGILHRIAFDRFVIDQEKVTGRADGQVIEVVAIYGIRDGPIVRVTFLR